MIEESVHLSSSRIDTMPDEQRQGELEAGYQQNIAQDKAPYEGVRIATYGELLWVFEQRRWSGEKDLPEGKQRPNLSRANMQGANLSEANLWEATLSGVDLLSANLSGVDLRQADLSKANLGNANLSEAHLMLANLSGAFLVDSTLSRAHLMSVNLSGGDLSRANLSGANMQEADLSGAYLYYANLSRVDLSRADLSGAKLTGANLSEAGLNVADLRETNLRQADLSRADLNDANLSGANLVEVNLSGANLAGADLSRANLRQADLTKAKLMDAGLDSGTALGDITWDGVSLSQVSWESVQHLGDDDVKRPDNTVRAYRQVATQLRSQGMNEVADRFAYLAQLWQRRIMRQRLRWGNLLSFGPYLGSLLLWAISGYGYRPSRTFVAYLLTVGGFAVAYYAVTHTVETQLAKLSWDEAFVLSLTSFHGRGFLPGFLALGDWVARIGALEAVIGLFIELILIATFSRRFLGN